jgi:hypothetical protein
LRIGRHAVPGEVKLAKLGLRHGHALLGGAGIPRRRRGHVTRDPGTVQVKHRDIELGVGVPLLSGPFEPARRVIEALWHALAAGVHSAQGELCLGFARSGGCPVPFRGLDLARCGAVTEIVQAGEAQHRGRIPHLRGSPKMGFGHDAVLWHAAALQEVQGKMVAGPSVPLVRHLLKERDGPRRIACEPLPCGAHQRQAKLGIGISLRRRLFVPASRGGQIDLDPEAVRVDDPKAELAGAVALFGGGGIPAPRL